MSPERVAVVWVLVIVLGLLLGLMILVVAFGVVRHLRRGRGKPDGGVRRGRRGGEDEGDAPVEWRKPGGVGDGEDSE